MNDHGFLKVIKHRGKYRTHGEASRAANAVFGTIKAWLTPAASEVLHKTLPGDAAQLWRYSPVVASSTPAGVPSQVPARSLQFILRVQQLGRYNSSADARRATCSVLGALAAALPVEPARFLGQVFPPEILGACLASSAGWAA